MKELDSYSFEVKESTETILKKRSYVELKRNVSEKRKEYLKSLNVVSKDETAIWLIDYWCNQRPRGNNDMRGLIPIPFSRPWIKHIETGLRIKNKIHS